MYKVRDQSSNGDPQGKRRENLDCKSHRKGEKKNRNSEASQKKVVKNSKRRDPWSAGTSGKQMRKKSNPKKETPSTRWPKKSRAERRRSFFFAVLKKQGIRQGRR